AWGNAETHAILRNDARSRWLGRPTVERFLLLDVLFGEPIELSTRVMAGQNVLKGGAKAVHARRKELQYERGPETVHDQATQAVSFRMNQAVRIGHGVESQPLPAQSKGSPQPFGKKGLVNRLVWICSQHTQGNPRMTVVKSPAHPLILAV